MVDGANNTNHDALLYPVEQVESCLNVLRVVSSNPGLNEEARKQLFVSYLRQMFPQPSNQAMIDALASGAETYVPTAPSSLSSSTRGFIDTHNGKLAVEFKANLLDAAATREAEIELKRYIAGLWTLRGIESSFCCIATDILRWKIWQPVPNVTPPDGRFTADMVSLQFAETISITEPNLNQAEALFCLLHRLLIDANLLEFSAENLRRDFGPHSAHYSSISSAIGEIVGQASTTPEVVLKIHLWEDYQAYNARISTTSGITLYCNHIYLAILTRFVVAAVFQARAQTEIDDDTIRGVLTGDFFLNRMRLVNFVEQQDFFGWIAAEPWIDRFLPLARQIYHSIRTYEFGTSTQENTLRLIYDEIMPVGLRDVLGQRSTPEPLAANVVAAVPCDYQSTLRCLDPACGTGTFLRAMLLAIRSRVESQGLNQQQLLSRLIDAVTGIDVDPVAVVISKAVWVLTLADLLPYAADAVSIPIYQADSLFVGAQANDELNGEASQARNTEIILDDTRIEIPNELAANPMAFDTLVTWCYDRARALARDVETNGGPLSEVAPETIASNLPMILRGVSDSTLLEKADVVASSASRVVAELAWRIIARRNGVWAFVLRNSARPSLLGGRFDVIISNPPWLAMSRLPDIPYRAQLEHLADCFGIKPGGSSFLHTEIATTFALHTVRHFLRDGGLAAFVMPRSLFRGANHSLFRSRAFAPVVPFAITEIWDLKSVDSLFRVPSCVLFGTKNQQGTANSSAPIRVRFWTDLRSDRDAVNSGLLTVRTVPRSVWIESTSPIQGARIHDHYTNAFRQGADLMPRTGLFVELENENPQQAIVMIRTSHIEASNRNNKVLAGHVFRGTTHRRYLFNTITSNVLLPFVILEDQLPIVLLPLELRDGQPVLVSEEDLINRGDAETARWFEAVDREVGAKKIRSRIDVRRKLTQQRYGRTRFLVHYGASGTYVCAAVQNLGRDSGRPFVADQTTYVYPTDSEEEAYFLVGVLNAPALARIISRFQAEGAFGERHIHKLPLAVIPPYNHEDSAHRKVVELAVAATRAAQAALTGSMRDLSRPLHQRRALLRHALDEAMDRVDEFARIVLQE